MAIEPTNNAGQQNPALKQVSRANPSGADDFAVILEEATSPVHVVKKGENLWRIVKERLYQFPGRVGNREIAQAVKLIAEKNRLQDPGKIYAGQRLDMTSLEERAQRADRPAIPGPEQLPPVPEKPPIQAVIVPTPAEQPVPAQAPAVTPPVQPPVPAPEQKPPVTERVPPAEQETQPVPITTPAGRTLKEQMDIYKIDQLLAAPGGDHFVHTGSTVEYRPDETHNDIGTRVGKDLSDARDNLARLLADLTGGSKTHYLAQDGTIKSRQRVGLLGALNHFVRDLATGISFGTYVPAGEERPTGMGRIKYFFNKVFKDALVRDLGMGATSAAASGLKHGVLAAINALETVPDATIGNFRQGEKVTTTVFDNGQVAVSYITDVLPAGEAWFRVHAPGSTQDGFQIPFLYNWNTREQGIDDPRWESVRNTKFRKTIETIGTILGDMSVLGINNSIIKLPQISGNKD